MYKKYTAFYHFHLSGGSSKQFSTMVSTEVTDDPRQWPVHGPQRRPSHWEVVRPMTRGPEVVPREKRKSSSTVGGSGLRRRSVTVCRRCCSILSALSGHLGVVILVVGFVARFGVRAIGCVGSGATSIILESVATIFASCISFSCRYR
jgi:hypothetical protein